MHDERHTLLVRKREAARRLDVCERTIDLMVARGEISKVKIGKSARYIVSELMGFIERQKAVRP
jgi:excisionase family DNA binding protein